MGTYSKRKFLFHVSVLSSYAGFWQKVDFHLYLKVSKSQKQFMVSSNLLKNECWDNCMY